MTISVEVYREPGELAHAVAGRLLGLLAAAQDAGDVPQIGLTGGTIADHMHRELARRAEGFDVDWGRVVVWWGDERFVPSDSPDRNAGQARRAFLDEVGASAVFEVPGADEVSTAEEAAAAYGESLRDHGAGSFSLLMLGLGPDGHTASLFPRSPALEVDDRPAVAVHDAPKPPPDRVSLTFAALNRAEQIWFLAAGEEKAEAVAAALADTGSSAHTPARGVTGTPGTSGAPGTKITWFLDQAAAALL